MGKGRVRAVGCDPLLLCRRQLHLGACVVDCTKEGDGGVWADEGQSQSTEMAQH